MIGHVSLGVKDLAVATAFYDAVMAALGFERVWTSDQGVGYGVMGLSEFLDLFPREDAAAPGGGFHLAFDAPSPEAVDRFHATALTHGGRNLGAPGPRPHYGATYYAAFVLDPDGYKLEAVHQ